MKHLNIKRALAEHNMTQVQLGEKMGVAPQSLTSVIKGNPTVKKLEDVAMAIGCDIIDLFFDGKDEPQEDTSTRSAFKFNGPFMDEPIDEVAQSDLFSSQSPSEIDDHTIKLPPAQDVMPVTTFCPHCGKRVRVGVVLLPEEV